MAASVSGDPGASFPGPVGIDDEHPGDNPEQHRIVALGPRCFNVFAGHAEIELAMDAFDFFKSSGRAVGDNHS